MVLSYGQWWFNDGWHFFLVGFWYLQPFCLRKPGSAYLPCVRRWQEPKMGWSAICRSDSLRWISASLKFHPWFQVSLNVSKILQICFFGAWGGFWICGFQKGSVNVCIGWGARPLQGAAASVPGTHSIEFRWVLSARFREVESWTNGGSGQISYVCTFIGWFSTHIYIYIVPYLYLQSLLAIRLLSKR